MDKEFLSKFPHIGEHIFVHYLDDASLIRCRKVCKTWRNYIDTNRKPWLRMIKRVKPNFDNDESWKGIAQLSLTSLRSIALMVKKNHHFCPWQKEDTKMPLHYAVRSRNLQIVQEVLEYSSDKNPTDIRGSTPMHFVASAGDIELMQVLISHVENKNPAAGADGDTPLHIAAKKGHLNMVKLLMKHTQDKNPRGRYGLTPFHLAAEMGHSDICKEFLENIEDKSPGCPETGFTPLWLALNKNNLPLFTLILSYLPDKNPIISIRLGVTTTTLHLAVKEGRMPFFQLLLDQNENKNPVDGEGLSLVHEAIRYGQTEMYNILMKHVNCKNPITKKGESLLHFAAALPNTAEFYQQVHQDIEAKDINPRNNEGETPMHYAAQVGNLSVYQYLSDQLKDAMPQSESGNTPIHVAARGSAATFNFVLNCAIANDWNVNPANYRGITPLHCAAESGSYAICSTILEHMSEESDKNPRAYDGSTPVHLAEKNKHFHVSHMLRKNYCRKRAWPYEHDLSE